MNVAAAFASFSYKVKALFRGSKKQTARIYEHVPTFERQNSKNAQKSPTKHSPKRSPSTPRKRNEPERPNEKRNYMSYLTNFKDSLVKLVSGADTEKEELIKPTRGKTESTAGTSQTATKVNKQTSYDIEATAGDDEFESKEDTKLLQEGEDDDEGKEFAEESKGTTSSLQAGWNISNLIQGKSQARNGDHVLLYFS
jgi:hypothetical protein